MTVEELLRQAGELDQAEQLRLIHSLQQLMTDVRPHTIPATALRGIGRELRDGTDAQEHVHAERDTWSG